VYAKLRDLVVQDGILRIEAATEERNRHSDREWDDWVRDLGLEIWKIYNGLVLAMPLILVLVMSFFTALRMLSCFLLGHGWEGVS
jgi:hypothetical protein